MRKKSSKKSRNFAKKSRNKGQPQVVDAEVPGAVEEEAGPAAVRRVPPGLLDALPVHALSALRIVVN